MIKQITLAATTFVLSTSVNAALLERLDGLALYDTDLGITWDARLCGRNDGHCLHTRGGGWDNATLTAEQSTLGGFTDWQLPTISQLSHLYYEYGIGQGTESPFIGYFGGNYNIFSLWSSQYSSQGVDYRYWFNYKTSTPDSQRVGSVERDWYAYHVAVRLGDVEPVSQVPIPAALWLFGSGLLGLVGVARHRKG